MIVNKNISFISNLYSSFVKFSVLSALLITASYLIYQVLPFIFYFRNIAGYPISYNILFGLTGISGDRPSWYFAEPSYSGFYLGIYLLMIIHQKMNKKRKIFYIAALISGIVFTASMGTFAYLLIVLPFVVMDKLKMSIKIQTMSFGIFMAAALIIISTFDFYGIDQEVFDLQKHNIGDRQERMLNAEEMANNNSIYTLLFGNGVEAATLKYDVGISDAYHKLYLEWGILFTISFLLFVWRETHKNFPAYVFIMLSFFSIIIHMTPIILVTYYFIFVEKDLIKYKTSSHISKSKEKICI